MRVLVSLTSPWQPESTYRRWTLISGATCLLMLVVGGSLQLGNVTVPPVSTAPRQITVGLLGFFLLLISVLRVENAGHARGAAHGPLGDPEFWKKVFDVMPPAFLKEYPNEGNLADNEPFRVIQGVQPRELDDSSEFHMLINADHRQGDKIAGTNGASAFLEFSDHHPTRHPQLIMTFKYRVEHEGKTYIAGWYLPVALGAAIPTTEKIEVAKRGEQVVFQVPPAVADYDGAFVMNVGKAVRRPDLYGRGPASSTQSPAKTLGRLPHRRT
jgi:hypothetical protein